MFGTGYDKHITIKKCGKGALLPQSPNRIVPNCREACDRHATCRFFSVQNTGWCTTFSNCDGTNAELTNSFTTTFKKRGLAVQQCVYGAACCPAFQGFVFEGVPGLGHRQGVASAPNCAQACTAQGDCTAWNWHALTKECFMTAQPPGKIVFAAANHTSDYHTGRRCSDATSCPWRTTTGQINVMECGDGSTCNGRTLGWDCCANKEGRTKCPANFPAMCAAKSCGSGGEYCCHTRDVCDFKFGGLRDSSTSECVPGKS